MPELKEVFEMTTKQIEPDLDAWREQEDRHRRANRNRKVGALVLVTTIAVVAAVVVVRSIGDGPTQPADRQSPSPNLVDPTAVPVATGFVKAFGDLNAQATLRYLADDVVLQLDATSREELPLLLSFWRAVGYEQIVVDSCRVTGNFASGTWVRCPFDFHAIRSDELGLGPYPGSWELLVRDGRIVIVAGQDLQIAQFSPQVWEPFAAWIDENYPDDGAVMYNADYTNFELTRGSIRLWEKRTKEYVGVVTAET